jgi:hypothetical protein
MVAHHEDSHDEEPSLSLQNTGLPWQHEGLRSIVGVGVLST